MEEERVLQEDIKWLVTAEVDAAMRQYYSKIMREVDLKLSKVDGAASPRNGSEIVSARSQTNEDSQMLQTRSLRRETSRTNIIAEETTRRWWGHDDDDLQVRADVELDPKFSGQVLIGLRNGDDVYGMLHPFKEDAYGAAMSLCCISMARLAEKTQMGISATRAIWSMGRAWFFLAATVTNVFFTISVCISVNLYLVEPYVRNVQKEYQSFHTEVFNQMAQFQDDLWRDSYDNKHSLCQIAMTNPGYLNIILCLHVMNCIVEFRETLMTAREVVKVKQCSSLREMLVWEAGQEELGGRCFVVAVTRPVRIALSVIILYKFVIAFFVLNLGSRLLCSSTEFADVLLNALTLQFICEIDNTIFSAFLPTSVQDTVRQTSLFVQGPKATAGVAHAMKRFDLKVGTFWACFCITFLLVYVNIVQTVLPADLSQVGKVCKEYLELSAPCNTRAIGLYFNPTECYPYGRQVLDEQPLYQNGAA